MDEDYAKEALAATVRELSRFAGQHPRMVMETTGASDRTGDYLAALAAEHDLFLVRVRASEGVCRDRIAARDPSRHVPVPAELVAAMYARSQTLQLDCALEISNDQGGDVEALADLIARRVAG